MNEWIIAADAEGRFHVIRTGPESCLGPFDTSAEAERAIEELMEARDRRAVQ